MSISYDIHARKRRVNLTLNPELVVQVRQVTNNLSRVVESLLAGFIAQERADPPSSVSKQEL
jgi:antitoxin CcdA